MDERFKTSRGLFDALKLDSYRGDDEVVVIPDEIGEIEAKTFKNKKIKKVIFPSALTTIHGHSYDHCGAFKDCILLESVEFSQNPSACYLYVYDEAFKGCVSLEKVVFPPIVVHVCVNSFENCASLKSVTFPRITKKIPPRIVSEDVVKTPITLGKGAFKNCRELKELIFESDIGEIEDGAFEGCTNLEEITLPYVKKMGKNVFSNCPKLKTIRTANKKGFLFFPPSGWKSSWKGDSTANVVWEYKK